MQPHSHKNGYLSIIIEGEVLESCNGKEYKRSPGMAVYHPAYGVHSNLLVSEYARLFHIELLKDYSRANFKKSGDFQIIFDEKVIKLIREIYFGFHKGDKLDLLTEIGIDVLSKVSKSNCKSRYLRRPDWLKYIIDFIDYNYSQYITLEILSEEVAIHPVHISRSFKKYMQCSFSSYIIKIRIEKACEKIKASNTQLCTVAYEVGFFDQSHFSKCFKKYTGLAPSQYKELSNISRIG